MVGLVVGMTRFAWSSAYPLVFCEEMDDTRPAVIKDVHYLHFGMLLFSLVFVVTVVVSLLTEPIDDKHASRTLFCLVFCSVSVWYGQSATVCHWTSTLTGCRLWCSSVHCWRHCALYAKVYWTGVRYVFHAASKTFTVKCVSFCKLNSECNIVEVNVSQIASSRLWVASVMWCTAGEVVILEPTQHRAVRRPRPGRLDIISRHNDDGGGGVWTCQHGVHCRRWNRRQRSQSARSVNSTVLIGYLPVLRHCRP